MSLIKILKENKFTANRFQRLSDFMDKHYFRLVFDKDLGYSKYYVGQGAEAQIYQSDKYPDVVLRISQQKDKEFKKIKGKDFDHVVHVKFFKELRSISLTVMEKLEPLNEKLKLIFEWMVGEYEEEYAKKELFSYEAFYIAYDKMDLMEKIYHKVLKDMEKAPSALTSHTKNSTPVKFNDIKKFIKDVNKGMDELSTVGIHHGDLHMGNIMYDPKSGNYKLIDV